MEGRVSVKSRVAVWCWKAYGVLEGLSFIVHLHMLYGLCIRKHCALVELSLHCLRWLRWL